MAERILLVEDEEKLARMVELELQYEGYEVEKAFDGRAGLDRALSGSSTWCCWTSCCPPCPAWRCCAACGGRAPCPSSCSLPGTPWWIRCPAWTWGRTTTLPSPLPSRSCSARIRAALRKRPAQAAEPPRSLLTAGPLTMDTDRHEVSVNGEGVELTRREFDLLRYLLENKERVISRESLLDHVWGFDFVGETNAVDVYIRFLRAKIDEHFGIKLIHTVRGVGYVIREEGQ